MNARAAAIGGELGYSISSYNGHIHGQCNTTRGCLSWMM